MPMPLICKSGICKIDMFHNKLGLQIKPHLNLGEKDGKVK